MTLLQLAVAAVDLCIAAGCLYVLVSHDLTEGYWEFLGMYLLAVVVVIITHVPGGLGVFELVVLTLAVPQSAPAMVAALLVFRIIYYLLPLLAAVLLLAGNEIVLQRAAAERVWQVIGRWSGPIIASLLAWATLIAGTVLLLSGATPIVHTRRESLEQTVPLPLIEVSHFVGSVAGAMLLLLARGLQRRLDSAWWLTIGLLGVGIVASLLRGFDYEVAFLLAVVCRVPVRMPASFLPQGNIAPRAVHVGLDRGGVAGDYRLDLRGPVCPQTCGVLGQCVVGVRVARRCATLPAGQHRRRDRAFVVRYLETRCPTETDNGRRFGGESGTSRCRRPPVAQDSGPAGVIGRQVVPVQ